MVFSSHIFLFWFLPLVLAAYYAAPRWARMPVLIAFSYLFYGWTNPWFCCLLAWSTVVDFVCGNLIYGHWALPGARRGIDANGHPVVALWQRRGFMILSLVSNLGMLAFFKYAVFALDNLDALFARFGAGTGEALVVLLPAGISFYTFESISYNLDIYFGRARPASAWVTEAFARAGRSVTGLRSHLLIELKALNGFACYITQYPHLVAGPVIRYQDLERQIHERTHSAERFARGIAFLACGLAKKVIIANPCGDVADAAFAAGQLSTLDAWHGVVAYAMQIYFDFSGYSDMAIGLALMLGFVFPKNFDSPYLAESITDFWRRWHISLSIWLRDYLYIPLGGNRLGEARTYCNLLLVMLLGGFWHGASWNFLIWGAIHGGWLALERFLGRDSFYARAPRPLRIAITFGIVCVAWVFFRAKTLPEAVAYCAALFGLDEVQPGSALALAVARDPWHLAALVAAGGIAWFAPQTWDFTKVLTAPRAAWCLTLFLVAVLLLWTQTANPFLYFQF